METIKKILVVNGTITVETGLHIGCGDDDISKIGGCDSPIIRDTLTNLPIIPGSSLKGKMRSCLELAGKAHLVEKADRQGNILVNPCGCGECIVCKIFGAHMKTTPKSGMPRLIVKDAKVNTEFLEKLKKSGRDESSLTEIITSTMISRKFGTATGGALRNFERVVAGTVFDETMVIKIFDNDNEAEIIKTIKSAIEQVNTLGLGAKTSSGSGSVTINMDWDNMKDMLK